MLCQLYLVGQYKFVSFGRGQVALSTYLGTYDTDKILYYHSLYLFCQHF